MFKPLKNNSGMTIISVVVAFGVLVTACILFTKSMQFATNMIIMSDDEKDGIEISVGKYYGERATEATTGASLEFNNSDDNTFAFKLTAPVAKTEPETTASGKPKNYRYGFEFFSSNEARGVEPETVPPPAGP